MLPLSLIPAPYQLLAKVIAGAVLVLACWYAWHQFTGHYIDIGREEVRKEMQPMIDALKLEKKTLQEAYSDLGTKATACSDSVRELSARSEKKKAAVTVALSNAEKRAIDAQRKAGWLESQLNQPGNAQKSCGDALKAWREQK